MKPCVICLLILAGQMMTAVSRPVVHLDPNQVQIPLNFAGDLLELINGPSTVFLPPSPPKPDSDGLPWAVSVKNMGPAAVAVEWGTRFHVPISVGQTVQIVSNGTGYSLKR
jgi:hypothetical protein